MSEKKGPSLGRKNKQFINLDYYDNVDSKIDGAIEEPLPLLSEKDYMSMVAYIVTNSNKQVIDQNKSKNGLKKLFTIFFIVFISIQYLALIFILMYSMFCPHTFLSDSIISLYITSVFVETLGGILLMVQYAFNSKQEVELIKTLNSAISDYQKINLKAYEKNEENEDQ